MRLLSVCATVARMTNGDDLVPSITAAEIVGVHRQTFNKFVNLGRIRPAVTVPGVTGARLFRREDVEAFAESRRLEKAS